MTQGPESWVPWYPGGCLVCASQGVLSRTRVVARYGQAYAEVCDRCEGVTFKNLSPDDDCMTLYDLMWTQLESEGRVRPSD